MECRLAHTQNMRAFILSQKACYTEALRKKSSLFVFNEQLRASRYINQENILSKLFSFFKYPYEDICIFICCSIT